MISVRFAAALLVLLAAGAGPAAVIHRGRAVRPLAFLGFSFVLGVGAAGLLSVFAMELGRTGPLVPLLAAVLGAALFWKFRPVFAPPEPRDVPSLVAHGVSGLAVALALFWAAASDDLGWDAEAFWSLKGRSIEAHGTFRNPDFLGEVRPHYHPRYPLLVPAVYAWIYEATGSTSGHLMRLVMALFYAASLPVVGRYLYDRLPGRAAAVLTAVYAFTPAFHTGGSGGAVSGYTDYPLTLFMLIAAAEARTWIEDRRGGAFAGAALALAFATQTKDDGTAFAAVLAGTVGVWSWVRGGLRAGLAGTAIALPAAAAAGAWFLCARSLPADELNIAASAGIQWNRLPSVAAQTGSMLIRFKEWGLLWPAAALLVCLRFPRLREPESLLMAAVAGMMAVYVVVWMAFPGEDARSVMKHMTLRPVMHVFPIAYVWTAGRLTTFPGLVR